MSAKLRVINASIDVPALDVVIDGKPLVHGLFKTDDSGYLSIMPGSHEVAVQNSNSYWPLVGPFMEAFENDASYTLLVTGHAYQGPGLDVRILNDAVVPFERAA